MHMLISQRAAFACPCSRRWLTGHYGCNAGSSQQAGVGFSRVLPGRYDHLRLSTVRSVGLELLRPLLYMRRAYHSLPIVLSIIFVVELAISTHGTQKPVYLPLSIDIPETYEGVTVDPCTIEIGDPGCAYNLALTALSAQMVSYQSYTMGGVTFDPPNGTMGLPYWALKHFSDSVETTRFEEEYRQYCLPVLDPHVISCK